MDYVPHPMDTGHIVLPEELAELTEKLAEKVHEVWAAGRLAQGWRYGKVRDDEAKTTPCLVPYAQLPESEKEYDRRTALETVKIILAMGYQIEKE